MDPQQRDTTIVVGRPEIGGCIWRPEQHDIAGRAPGDSDVVHGRGEDAPSGVHRPSPSPAEDVR